VSYRIHRAAGPDSIVFTLSGEMDGEHVERLRELLAAEIVGRIVLDLQEVTLVDRVAVQFLTGIEGPDVRIANCPEYVRSWIAAERAFHEPLGP